MDSNNHAELPDNTGNPSAAERHNPVLFNEVLSFFELKDGGRYLDATLGMGGHSEGLLQKAAAEGRTIELLGMDRDTEALALAEKRLASFAPCLHTLHGCFADVDDALDEQGWDTIDGAFIDIGVSSFQIDEADRGFSFQHDGPLDMRMDRFNGQPASALVNKASVQQLKDIISRYGEDPMAGRIARAIDDARAEKPLTTTAELAHVVSQAYPVKWRVKSRNHPATRTFQALRMAVNDELDELRSFLDRIVPRLAKGGRVAVISFHSLEDRIVKHFFRDKATGCRCPKYVRYCVCGIVPVLSVLTKKPVGPSDAEARENPRAGSAKLRVAEKL